MGISGVVLGMGKGGWRQEKTGNQCLHKQTELRISAYFKLEAHSAIEEWVFWPSDVKKQVIGYPRRPNLRGYGPNQLQTIYFPAGLTPSSCKTAGLPEAVKVCS